MRVVLTHHTHTHHTHARTHAPEKKNRALSPLPLRPLPRPAFLPRPPPSPPLPWSESSLTVSPLESELPSLCESESSSSPAPASLGDLRRSKGLATPCFASSAITAAACLQASHKSSARVTADRSRKSVGSNYTCPLTTADKTLLQGAGYRLLLLLFSWLCSWLNIYGSVSAAQRFCLCASRTSSLPHPTLCFHPSMRSNQSLEGWSEG